MQKKYLKTWEIAAIGSINKRKARKLVVFMTTLASNWINQITKRIPIKMHQLANADNKHTIIIISNIQLINS